MAANLATVRVAWFVLPQLVDCLSHFCSKLGKYSQNKANRPQLLHSVYWDQGAASSNATSGRTLLHRGLGIINITGYRGDVENSHIIQIFERRNEQQGCASDVCLFARLPGDGPLEASLGSPTMSIPFAKPGLERS